MNSELCPLVCSPSPSPVAKLAFVLDTPLYVAGELHRGPRFGRGRGQVVKGLQLLRHREPGCSSGCEMNHKTSNQDWAPVLTVDLSGQRLPSLRVVDMALGLEDNGLPPVCWGHLAKWLD